MSNISLKKKNSDDEQGRYFTKHLVSFAILPSVKKETKDQNGVPCSKPHQDLSTNLTAVSASPRNGILKQSIQTFLVRAGEVICNLADKTRCLREDDFA